MLAARRRQGVVRRVAMYPAHLAPERRSKMVPIAIGALQGRAMHMERRCVLRRTVMEERHHDGMLILLNRKVRRGLGSEVVVLKHAKVSYGLLFASTTNRPGAVAFGLALAAHQTRCRYAMAFFVGAIHWQVPQQEVGRKDSSNRKIWGGDASERLLCSSQRFVCGLRGVDSVDPTG